MLGLTQVTAVLTSNSQVRSPLKTSVCILIAQDSAGYRESAPCLCIESVGREKVVCGYRNDCCVRCSVVKK